jgi:hypothetical protein
VASEADVRKLALALPHYDGHPGILVRLAAVDRVELAELLEESWRFRGGSSRVEQFDRGR